MSDCDELITELQILDDMTKGHDMKKNIEALSFCGKQLHISLDNQCLQLFNITTNSLIHCLI